ncbi:MAG TPA: hypothetical protein VIO43_02150 [Lutibacter sp.]
MTSKHQRKISYTFKDYENDYDSLWVEFLNKHEDFGIVYFIENEIEFYSMCYESSCITPIENTGSVKKYVINQGGTSDGLIEEIYKNLLRPDLQDGWDFELSSKYKATFKKIINFLEIKKQQYFDEKNSTSLPIFTNDDIPKQQVNPYPHIFSNVLAFNFFEKLFNLFKESDNKMADFSFLYRMMYKDGFILSHFKPQMFVNWIDQEPFKISLDKLKTLNKCTTNKKLQIYSTLKEYFPI